MSDVHVQLSIRKTTENKASFGMMVTNLDKCLVVLVQMEREDVGRRFMYVVHVHLSIGQICRVHKTQSNC